MPLQKEFSKRKQTTMVKGLNRKNSPKENKDQWYEAFTEKILQESRELERSEEEKNFESDK